MTVLHEANIRKILVYGKAGPQGCEIYEPSLAFKAPLVAGLSRSSMSSTSPKGHLGMMWTSIGKTEESCGCADLSSVAQTRASPAVAPRIKSQSSFSELRPSRRRPYLICRDNAVPASLHSHRHRRTQAWAAFSGREPGSVGMVPTRISVPH